MRNHRVFKFRAGNANDLDALFESYVWFAGLSALNDPYEGFVALSNENIDDDFREKYLAAVYSKEPKKEITPEKEASKVRKECQGDSFSEYVDSKTAQIITSYYDEHKNDFKIFSLSLAKEQHEFPAPLNNMLMWSHYANGFKGFCIEFDFKKLKESIEANIECELGTSQVKYATDGKLPVVNMKTFMQSTIDDSKDSSFEIIEAFTKKEQSWGYENEVRFLSTTAGKHKYSADTINAIYVSENAPNWLKQSLMTFAVANSDLKLFLVKLHRSEYKFGFERINA
ncbi:DUF2971 domain-containing protein [Catenovulum sediminis]|uniref:DUF2971 domain-containing protein n=1 Tax=Catenovulum sediminis TaxID=1740262 RepID=A0ABV1RLB0_9ALTE